MSDVEGHGHIGVYRISAGGGAPGADLFLGGDGGDVGSAHLTVLGKTLHHFAGDEDAALVVEGFRHGHIAAEALESHTVGDGISH